jgi:hypothetical protein
MIPAGVLHHPTVIMMDDGHRIARTSVLPSTIISHIPYCQRRPRAVPHTVKATVLAMIAICFVFIPCNRIVHC